MPASSLNLKGIIEDAEKLLFDPTYINECIARSFTQSDDYEKHLHIRFWEKHNHLEETTARKDTFLSRVSVSLEPVIDHIATGADARLLSELNIHLSKEVIQDLISNYHSVIMGFYEKTWFGQWSHYLKDNPRILGTDDKYPIQIGYDIVIAVYDEVVVVFFASASVYEIDPVQEKIKKRSTLDTWCRSYRVN